MGISTFLNLAYLKLAFICHFSIDQGVLPLRQMSKTLLEKKVINSLAEAELLMMLSSGRMMSLCLQRCIRSGRKKTLYRKHTFLRFLQCGSPRSPGGAILDERGGKGHSPPDMIL